MHGQALVYNVKLEEPYLEKILNIGFSQSKRHSVLAFYSCTSANTCYNHDTCCSFNDRDEQFVVLHAD